MKLSSSSFQRIVPSNASRFFDSQKVALGQDPGIVDLHYDSTGFIYNRGFRPDLIKHDEHYTTQVADLQQEQVIATTSYFRALLGEILDHSDLVVDIGSGQGEFVKWLQDQGFRAEGFDPVLRQTTSTLHPYYWEPGLILARLFVMRCVLPHIFDPWSFLDKAFALHPDSMFLIEYQRIEWAIQQGLWYQVNHDHVNYFRTGDFRSRYDIIGLGTFGEGEWGYVLIRKGNPKEPTSTKFDRPPDFGVFSQLESRFNLNIRGETTEVIVWGAAGKGTVLAHHLSRVASCPTLAVDSHNIRWGKYLELSGVQVLPPDIVKSDYRSSLIIVANPNHLMAVRSFIPHHRVVSGGDLSLQPKFR